jgi:hypothetical protein
MSTSSPTNQSTVLTLADVYTELGVNAAKNFSAPVTACMLRTTSALHQGSKGDAVDARIETTGRKSWPVPPHISSGLR